MLILSALSGARSQEFHSSRHMCCDDVTIKVILFYLKCLFTAKKFSLRMQNMQVANKSIHAYTPQKYSSVKASY